MKSSSVKEIGYRENKSTKENSLVDGMYALAQLFPDREEVRLKRDRWGIKSLFYRKLSQGYAFASEIHPLTQIKLPPLPRKEAVAEFLAFGRTLGNQTFYQDIWSVPPGSTVLLKQDLAEVKESLNSPIAGVNGITSGDLKIALRESLKKCLLSERNLGLALSGGLDSTILAFELNDLGIENLITISVCIPGVADGVKQLTELELPSNGAWRTWQHHVVNFTIADLPKLIKDAVAVMGQPTSMTSVPLYLKLARAAKKVGITVLLTGEGADELFGGYPKYLYWRDRLSNLKGFEKLREFAFPSHRRSCLKQIMNQSALSWCDRKFEATYYKLAQLDDFKALRQLELSLHLEPLLTRLDCCLMRYSIEGRPPYLHGYVPAVAAVMQPEQLLGCGVTKLALRKTWQKIIPHQRSLLKKHHFRIPISSWFLNNPWIVEQIHERRNLLKLFSFNLEGVEALLEAALNGNERSANFLYSLLSLLLWQEREIN